MPIVEVEQLAKTFRSRERASGLAQSLQSFVAPRYRTREAVKHISFALDAGELEAIFLHKTHIVFLDEPTIVLDVIAKQRIVDLIGLLNVEEGVTVFLTSHDAGDVEQVCSRAVVINHGEIILDESVAILKRD